MTRSNIKKKKKKGGLLLTHGLRCSRLRDKEACLPKWEAAAHMVTPVKKQRDGGTHLAPLGFFTFLFCPSCGTPGHRTVPPIFRSFFFSEMSLEAHSEMLPEVCLLGDFKSHLGNSKEQPSQAPNRGLGLSPRLQTTAFIP